MPSTTFGYISPASPMRPLATDARGFASLRQTPTIPTTRVTLSPADLAEGSTLEADHRSGDGEPPPDGIFRTLRHDVSPCWRCKTVCGPLFPGGPLLYNQGGLSGQDIPPPSEKSYLFGSYAPAFASIRVPSRFLFSEIRNRRIESNQREQERRPGTKFSWFKRESSPGNPLRRQPHSRPFVSIRGFSLSGIMNH
jgi:hypothetical protein